MLFQPTLLTDFPACFHAAPYRICSLPGLFNSVANLFQIILLTKKSSFKLSEIEISDFSDLIFGLFCKLCRGISLSRDRRQTLRFRPTHFPLFRFRARSLDRLRMSGTHLRELHFSFEYLAICASQAAMAYNHPNQSGKQNHTRQTHPDDAVPMHVGIAGGISHIFMKALKLAGNLKVFNRVESRGAE